MPKRLSEILDIQNEIVRIKEDIKSVDGDELRSLEERLRSYLKLQANGGRTPTKRDENGNVLLYEDPLQPGTQLQQTNQYINVELIKPDYDDDQVVEVLDTEINELFTSEIGELSRLQQQVEDLRNQLKDATAPINIIQQSGSGFPGIIPPEGTGSGFPGVIIPPEGTGSIFPDFGIVLPDSANGDLSNTPLVFSVNTAIFNDTNYILENFGAANPFPIDWWIIDRTTEEIYKQGTNETLFTNEDLVGLENKDLDLVLLLSDIPNNFNGWYFNDTSINQFVNHVKISNDPIIRVQLSKRHKTTSSLLNSSLNFHYFNASFLNEIPYPSPTSVEVTINVKNALVTPTGHVGTLSFYDIAKVSLKETTQTGEVVQQKDNVLTPTSFVVHQGNKIELTAAPTSIPDGRFKAWYVKSLFNNSYNLLSNNQTFVTTLDIIVSDTLNWLIGYTNI